MLVLHLQENCPSAALLETELIPEISGKIRMGRSEEAITADLIRGIQLVLAFSVGRIWGRNLGHKDTVKNCCDSKAWMECCQTDEMHQWEEKTPLQHFRKHNKKEKSKVFSLDYSFALVS